jgi:hypothetical protein
MSIGSAVDDVLIENGGIGDGGGGGGCGTGTGSGVGGGGGGGGGGIGNIVDDDIADIILTKLYN